MNDVSLNIACFASPHGFGHAARASAVITALQDLLPGLHVDIFSLTPPWFFAGAVSGSHTWYELCSDIGLVQDSPLVEDLDATIRQLSGFLPFRSEQLDSVAAQLKQAGCRLVICDISPLGIAVAEKLGLPSVLVENFTWDWIYQGYPSHQERFAPFVTYLREIFAKASCRIQAEPYCQEARADLRVGPVSRSPRHEREDIRRQLKVPDSKRLVLVTMGGIQEIFRHLGELKRFRDCLFLVPGDNRELQLDDNLLLLPYHSGLYHPDLVQAADVVIGKVGYSTLSEVYHAGVPFGYFTRPGFRESDVLSGFVSDRMPGIMLPDKSYVDGSWIDQLPELLSMQKVERKAVNGAQRIAEFIAALIMNRREG